MTAQASQQIGLGTLGYTHRHVVGRAYLMKGEYAEAIAALERARLLSGDQLARKAALGYAYALAGRRSEAHSLWQELKQTGAPAFPMALLTLSLGQRQEALNFLERAYQERHSDITRLKVEPLLDPLRDDPRFQDLLRRVGLPP